MRGVPGGGEARGRGRGLAPAEPVPLGRGQLRCGRSGPARRAPGPARARTGGAGAGRRAEDSDARNQAARSSESKLESPSIMLASPGRSEPVRAGRRRIRRMRTGAELARDGLGTGRFLRRRVDGAAAGSSEAFGGAPCPRSCVAACRNWNAHRSNLNLYTQQ